MTYSRTARLRNSGAPICLLMFASAAIVVLYNGAQRFEVTFAAL
jgi:hypothetical protein